MKPLPVKGAGVNHDNIAANRIGAAAHCFETKCFGVLCAGHLDHAAVKALAGLSNDSELASSVIGKSPRGATMFLDPNGTPIMGFTVDPVSGQKQQKEYLQAEEAILYTNLI